MTTPEGWMWRECFSSGLAELCFSELKNPKCPTHHMMVDILDGSKAMPSLVEIRASQNPSNKGGEEEIVLAPVERDE